MGNVYYTDPVHRRLYKIGADGKATVFKENTGGAGALAFGPEGRLYAAQSEKKRIVAYDPTGKETVIAGGVAANSLVCNHKGALFLTEAPSGKIWRIDRDGKRHLAGMGDPNATGIQLTPDQTLLLVNSAVPGKFCHSYQVQADGSLAQPEPFFDLYIPFGQPVSGAGGMATDTQGRLYVSSLGGIQLCDQAGRVIGILANPERQPTTQVVFGGPALDTLYVAAGGKVYLRKTKAKGVLPFQDPIRPPAPVL
jgi:gluconolactonase